MINNEESKETTVFTLKNALFLLGILIALIFGVRYVTSWFQQNHAQPQTPSQFQDDDVTKLITFPVDKYQLYTLDPLDPELKANHVCTRFDIQYRFLKLTEDKKKVYYWKYFSLQVIDKEIDYEESIKLPEFHSPCGVILNKQGIVYTALIHTDSVIRRYSLDTRQIISDHDKHKCDLGSPDIVKQSKDGSKIFYRCTGAEVVYMMDLNNPELEHREAFKLSYFQKCIFSPDETKVFI